MSALVKILFAGAYLGEPIKHLRVLGGSIPGAISHGVTKIDSSQIYGEPEGILGTKKAGERFILHTKWMGGVQPDWTTKGDIVNSGKESIKKLAIK
jgi:aryl-alcohol dehydrogenase-like predicted oxidoreductase